MPHQTIVKVTAPSEPRSMTAEERALHELTHLPYHPGCPECVAGRGRDAAHLSTSESSPQPITPVIQCDYCSPTEESASGEKHRIAVFVAVDQARGVYFPTPVQRKGSADTHAATAFANWILELGYNKLAIQPDKEHSARDLLKSAVAKTRLSAEIASPEQISQRVSPESSHQSNGAAERACGMVEGMFRTSRATLEKKLGTKLPLTHNIFLFLVQYVGWSLTHFQRKQATGLTGFEAVHLKKYKSDVLPFGDAVLAREPGVFLHKAVSRWHEGVWIGRSPVSDEHMVLTQERGLLLCRTIKRLVPEQQFLLSRFSFPRTPWKTQSVMPGRPVRAAAAATPLMASQATGSAASAAPGDNPSSVLPALVIFVFS